MEENLLEIDKKYVKRGLFFARPYSAKTKTLDEVKPFHLVNKIIAIEEKKQQKEKEIYHKYLLDKVSSSILKDFLTIRYRK